MLGKSSNTKPTFTLQSFCFLKNYSKKCIEWQFKNHISALNKTVFYQYTIAVLNHRNPKTPKANVNLEYFRHSPNLQNINKVF